MSTLCQCKPEPTGQKNLAQCRRCSQFYQIDTGKPCDPYGRALGGEEVKITTIKCSSCFRPHALSDGFIEAIREERLVTLPCKCRVPVGGKEGVLERVRKAKEETERNF